MVRVGSCDFVDRNLFVAANAALANVLVGNVGEKLIADPLMSPVNRESV
jgi:hypothetical protein